MKPEANHGSSLDDRLTARREHLMTEIYAQSQPARHGSAGFRRRAAVIAGSVAIISAGGAGAVYALDQSSATPNVIHFNRLQTSCNAHWSCLTRAATTVRHPVLGPSTGEQIGALVADGSPKTDESILSYTFRPTSRKIVIHLYARSGHDSAMRDVLAPPDAAANDKSVTIADHQGYIAASADGTNMWVSIDGMNYRFTTSDPHAADMQAAASTLVLVNQP
jgi:hypothetical protein